LTIGLGCGYQIAKRSDRIEMDQSDRQSKANANAAYYYHHVHGYDAGFEACQEQF